MTGIYSQELAAYFTHAAQLCGQDAHELQAGFSLLWYFEHYLEGDLHRTAPDDEPHLLRLYLGGLTGNDLDHYRAAVETRCRLRDAELAAWVSGASGKTYGSSLNLSQQTAVANALTLPISFVQGPPGTGKTETIAQMAALAADRGQTVAIVSTNGTAVDNVAAKLRTLPGVAGTARLGNSQIRKDYGGFTAVRAADRVAYEDDGAGSLGSGKYKSGWERSLSFSEFTTAHPIILSTVHSLKKCFVDGALKQYDVLILDETSQANLMVGIVALSSARRLVLVGDDDQLPPIYDHDRISQIDTPVEVAGQPFADSPWNMNATGGTRYRDPSFLSSCAEVFAPDRDDPARIMLDEHYRCHPGIIGFSNQEIYGGRLTVHPQQPTDPSDHPCPITVIWYEGDYRETRDLDGRTSVVNERQLTILHDQLGPTLKQQLADGKTVCALSPFRAQTERLAEVMAEVLGQRDPIPRDTEEPGGDTDNEQAPDSLSTVSVGPDERLKISTVHKSQGQEFDIVYLLPVEDGNWEWPWSQGRRLVNVAVTRAKQELTVITSTKMMDPQRQRQLTGCALNVNKAAIDEDDPEQQWMYVRKLVEYVADGFSWDPPRRYGLHRTTLRSLFDQRSVRQGPHHAHGTSARERDFAPEQCVHDALQKMITKRFSRDDLQLLTHVSLQDLRVDGSALEDGPCAGADPDVAAFVGNAQSHLDLVVVSRSTRTVQLAVEVDGGYHRYQPEAASLQRQQRHDRWKDELMRECGAQVWRGNRSRGFDDHAALVFLRLPDDGSTYAETDVIRDCARRDRADVSDRVTLEYLLAKQLKASRRRTVTIVG